MSKTYNRGKLLRLAKAGLLVRVSSYHFDDMDGAERIKAGVPEVPVRVITSGSEWKEGFCNVYPSDFSTSGRAWLNDNGTICLYVHSNCNYDFRIVDTPNVEAVTV